MTNISNQELNHILNHTDSLWDELRGERLFITGGTGFFGCWFLESFLHVNQERKLGAKITILSRSPENFYKKMPHLRNRKELEWVQGDVSDFIFPAGNFSHVIHAATNASAEMTRKKPGCMFRPIIEGTKHTLEFANKCVAKKILFTSSGAVYGPQPADLLKIPEEYSGGPDPLDPLSVYAEAKRAAENLCSFSLLKSTCEVKIARCFAFVGPYLPVNSHFAIGNFISDAIAGRDIIIKGDGTPLRSYLYSSDMIAWLWTILFNGKHLRPYNVGSDISISISELAELIARQQSRSITIKIMKEPDITKPIERYIPNVARAQNELGLDITIPLEQAIKKTVDFYQEMCKNNLNS